MENNLLKKRWFYVVNGIMVLLFMGVSNAWSIFVVPLENTFGWTRAQTSFIFTLNIIAFPVGSLSTGFLSSKLKFSTLLKISACLIGGGFMLCSIANEVWMFYITYSFMIGVGIGIGYNSIISAIPTWFPEKSGMITGILLMGFALSTAILGPVINSLIISASIATTFRILCAICFVIIMLGSFNVRVPTVPEIRQLPEMNRQSGKQSYNVITAEMIKKPIFWVYFFLTALLAGMGLTLLNHASPMMVEELHQSSTLAAFVISIISIANGSGRVIWGTLFDKLGMLKAMYGISCLMCVAAGVLMLSILTKQPIIFIGGACLLLFCFGGNASLMPSVTRLLFGHRTFALNYSVLGINALLQSMMPSIAGSLQIASGNYSQAVIMMFGASILIVLLTILFHIIYKKTYN